MVAGRTWTINASAPPGLGVSFTFDLDPSFALSRTFLDGLVLPAGADGQPEPGKEVLQFFNFSIGTDPARVDIYSWSIAPCVANSCGGGAFRGTAVITPVDPIPPVPLPASVALLPLGLAAFAVLRRRRQG
jgi:hypothetical protein